MVPQVAPAAQVSKAEAAARLAGPNDAQSRLRIQPGSASWQRRPAVRPWRAEAGAHRLRQNAARRQSTSRAGPAAKLSNSAALSMMTAPVVQRATRVAVYLRSPPKQHAAWTTSGGAEISAPSHSRPPGAWKRPSCSLATGPCSALAADQAFLDKGRPWPGWQPGSLWERGIQGREGETWVPRMSGTPGQSIGFPRSCSYTSHILCHSAAAPQDNIAPVSRTTATSASRSALTVA